jgi:hypothetical protein
MFQTNVEKIKTHFVFKFFLVLFFGGGSQAIYELMWKNMVDPTGTDGNIQRRMCIACGTNKAANTQNMLGICYNAFPLQQWLRERPPVRTVTVLL